MDDLIAQEILAKLQEIIAQEAPGLASRTMYGGLVFEREPGVASSLVGGLFSYQQHVSLDFSLGAQLPDPDGFLEGGGKYRRHLKFKNLEDVTRKKAATFVRAAVELAEG